MFPVESSFIESYGYDPDKLELDIQFHEIKGRGGKLVRYFGVTQDRFEDFVRASSKGRHWTEHIKGKYEWKER